MQEYEREQTRLRKEQQHYRNLLDSLLTKGDDGQTHDVQAKLDDLGKALDGIAHRVANIRAGYVYVISNIGSFGENVVKVGMTRRLEPMDRVRELGDASVPFRFDVHALLFSEDVVGLEGELHARLADCRINRVSLRREFFRATPAEVKDLLKDIDANLLDYTDNAEAAEYRQSQTVSGPPTMASAGASSSGTANRALLDAERVEDCLHGPGPGGAG
ncbi:MAG: GIY-YIG nuclease family protein [Nocardioidaceae bacterium]